MKSEDKTNKILELVNNKPGIKATELVTDYISHAFETEGKYDDDVLAILDDLVKRGELVEVEYVLPDMNYRVKSMYFPKGTIVSIPGNYTVTSVQKKRD